LMICSRCAWQSSRGRPPGLQRNDRCRSGAAE
jgi:hypothetical protein